MRVTVSGPSSPAAFPGSAVTHPLQRDRPVPSGCWKWPPASWPLLGELVSPMRLSGMQVPVSMEAVVAVAHQAPQVEAAVVDAVADPQDVLVRPPGY